MNLQKPHIWLAIALVSGMVSARGAAAQGISIGELGVLDALQSAQIDPVGLPEILSGTWFGLVVDAELASGAAAARERYLIRRARRRTAFEQARRTRRSGYERAVGQTINPGYRVPPAIGHFHTRFGFVTGPSLRRF